MEAVLELLIQQIARTRDTQRLPSLGQAELHN